MAMGGFAQALRETPALELIDEADWDHIGASQPFGVRVHYAAKRAERDGKPIVQAVLDEVRNASPADLSTLRSYAKSLDRDFDDLDSSGKLNGALGVLATLNPFSGETDEMSVPDPEDGRPPKVEGVPDPLKFSPEDIQSAIKSEAIKDPGFEQTMASLASGKSPVNTLHRLADDYEDTQDEQAAANIRTINRAWAFHTALETSKKVEAMLPKDVKEPGKAPGPESGQSNDRLSKRHSRRAPGSSPTAPWAAPQTIAKQYQRDLRHRIEQILG